MKNLERLINWQLILIILGLGLGQLLRYQVTPSIAIYFHDLMIPVFVVTALVWLIYYRHHWQLDRGFTQLLLLGVWFVITWGLSTLTWGVSATIPGLLYLARLWLWISFGVALYQLVNVNKKLPDRMTRTLLVSLVISLILGLLQYLLIPDTRILLASGWDNHLYRLIGTYFDPGFTGLMFILGLILVLTTKPRYHQWLSLLLIIGTLLTYSRASILTLIAVLVVCLVGGVGRQISKKLAVSLLAMTLINLTLLPQVAGEGTNLARTTSVTNRVDSNKDALDATNQNWLYGIGFNNYRLISQATQVGKLPHHANSPDNSFMFVWLTSGVVGLGLFMWWLFKLFQSGNHLITLSVVAISTHSLFNNSWFYSFVFVWLLIIVSLYDNACSQSE